jgi:hypothetical protein
LKEEGMPEADTLSGVTANGEGASRGGGEMVSVFEASVAVVIPVRVSGVTTEFVMVGLVVAAVSASSADEAVPVVVDLLAFFDDLVDFFDFLLDLLPSPFELTSECSAVLDIFGRLAVLAGRGDLQWLLLYLC